MTQLLTPPTRNSSSLPADEDRVLLQGISWNTYCALLKDVGDGAARLTYNNGDLEIEVPGRLHELIRLLIAEMVTAALKRRRIVYEPAGATTWRKYDHLKALEADESYHIQNAGKVIGKSELDLATDPPPDLAIEVEVSSPSMNKMEVYRELKVPELWRVRADGSCSMHQLDTGGAYVPIQSSVAIPLFTPALVSHYLLLREELGHSQAITLFEEQVLGVKQS